MWSTDKAILAGFQVGPAWLIMVLSHGCRWGHVLADGAVGKGHGSRALLHALKTNFVMHDSSYSCPMQLTGSKASLMQLVNQIRCESCFACFASNTQTCQNCTRIVQQFTRICICSTCILKTFSLKRNQKENKQNGSISAL